jgi:hypothetical protein
MSVHHITKRKILYIDSGQQLTATNNVFQLSIDADLEEEYDMCSLISAQIPVSFYIVQTGSNIMYLLEGAQTVTVTIPEGNYSVYSFQSTVGPLLSSLSPNGFTYTILFNNIFTQVDTGKFTFQCSSTAQTVGFQFPPNNAVGEVFGFFPSTTNYFTVDGPIQTLASKNVLSFIPESSIFIHANFCQGSSQSGYTDVLSCIFSSNSAPYSTINYTNPQIYETAKKTTSLSRVMVFSITDEFGNSINCNGGNVILQILLYKSPEQTSEAKFNKMVQDYIEMKTNLLEYDLREKQELKMMIQTINQTLLQLVDVFKDKLNVSQSKDGTITENAQVQDFQSEANPTQENAKQYFAGEAPTGESNESSNPPQ